MVFRWVKIIKVILIQSIGVLPSPIIAAMQQCNTNTYAQTQRGKLLSMLQASSVSATMQQCQIATMQQCYNATTIIKQRNKIHC